MKYSVPVFLATAAYAVAAFMPDLNNATLAETPVIVKVTCDGVDFTKLSLIADTLGGNFLEASYNNVHSSADNDDSELNSLTYNGSGNTFGWNFRSSNYGKLSEPSNMRSLCNK